MSPSRHEHRRDLQVDDSIDHGDPAHHGRVGLDDRRPRPIAGVDALGSPSETIEPGEIEIEVLEDIAREALERDGGRSLAMRLAALDDATEHAAAMLAEESWSEAMSAWARVTFAAEAVFGPDDPAVLDAMRITASIMRRVGLSHDATHLLCEVAERTLRAEGPETPRMLRVRAELEATLAA